MVNWESTTIGELLEFKNGLNKGKEFFGKGTPIVNYRMYISIAESMQSNCVVV
jgi:hypothetical protein